MQNQPSLQQRKHSLARIAVLLLAGTAILGIAPIVIFQIYDPWSKVCCKVYEINIKTGQMRISRYLYFRVLWHEVRDTPLSIALGGESIEVVAIEPWHEISVFSPSSPHSSPLCLFHNAGLLISQFDSACKRQHLTKEEKRRIAEGILTRWQEDGRSITYIYGEQGLIEPEERSETFGMRVENEKTTDSRSHSSTNNTIKQYASPAPAPPH